MYFYLIYLTSFLLFSMSDNNDKANSNDNYCCSKRYGCYTLNVSFLLVMCKHMLFHVLVEMPCAYSLPQRTFVRQPRTGAKMVKVYFLPWDKHEAYFTVHSSPVG